jgi:hypothetical protein
VERGTLALEPERRESILGDLRARAQTRSSANPAAFNLARRRALQP